MGGATAWDDIFYQVFLDRIEPRLAAAGPTFVFDWPAPLAALARPKPGDPRVVERFELYANGLELANAFGELTDPVEQRRRFEEEAAIRAERGRDLYPIDEELAGGAAAHAAHAGIALGFDRLVMLVLGVKTSRKSSLSEAIPRRDRQSTHNSCPAGAFLLCVARLEAVVTHQFLNVLAQAAAPSGGAGGFLGNPMFMIVAISGSCTSW